MSAGILCGGIRQCVRVNDESKLSLSLNKATESFQRCIVERLCDIYDSAEDTQKCVQSLNVIPS